MEIRLRQLAGQAQGLATKTKGDGRRIAELTMEKMQLAARIRDRDEELRGKAKLLEVG